MGQTTNPPTGAGFPYHSWFTVAEYAHQLLKGTPAGMAIPHEVKSAQRVPTKNQKPAAVRQEFRKNVAPPW